MKAFVDDDLCAGHGICVVTCPSVFALTDDGYAEAVSTAIPPNHATVVREAADNCPERAINLYDTEG